MPPKPRLTRRLIPKGSSPRPASGIGWIGKRALTGRGPTGRAQGAVDDSGSGQGIRKTERRDFHRPVLATRGHPNMTTMLATIVTDAAMEPALLAEILRQAVEVSFNCISIDGDMSTNDTVLLLANEAAGPKLEAGSWNPSAFASTLTLLASTSPSRSSATVRARPNSSRSGLKARRPPPMHGLPQKPSPTRRW